MNITRLRELAGYLTDTLERGDFLDADDVRELCHEVEVACVDAERLGHAIECFDMDCDRDVVKTLTGRTPQE